MVKFSAHHLGVGIDHSGCWRLDLGYSDDAERGISVPGAGILHRGGGEAQIRKPAPNIPFAPGFISNRTGEGIHLS